MLQDLASANNLCREAIVSHGGVPVLLQAPENYSARARRAVAGETPLAFKNCEKTSADDRVSYLVAIPTHRNSSPRELRQVQRNTNKEG